MNLLRPQRIPASALAVAAIFSVQFGNAFAGSLFDRVDPLGAVALRLALAALILLVLIRPKVRDWTRRTWLGVVVLGLGMGGMNVFFYFAISEIPFGIAVTIELMGPLAVAAMGIRCPLDIGWVLLALGGILLLGLGVDAGAGVAGALSFAGLVFAAVAAAFWAVYILAAARLSARVRGVDGLVMAMLVAAVAVVPFGAAPAVEAIGTMPILLPLFLGIAVLTSVVPYALEFLALKRMPSRVFGVLSSLGPAVAALAGLVVLQQRLEPLQTLAILLVVAASAGVVATSRRR